MKRLITVLALFMSAVMLAGCSKPAPEPLPEDGGHVSESDKDAPTQIVSTDIVRFECCFSTLSLDGDDELGNCVYRMKAVLEDDVCSADYSIVSSDGQSVEYSFETDESFMQSLQGIMEDHSLEKNNGLYEKTEGLPDMYGAELRVRYASGESVTAYDNEENFLSPAAMKALKQLFDDNSAVDEPGTSLRMIPIHLPGLIQGNMD
ncbi:MAG: hypothetical protein IKM51_00810 [Oscillospiraceae bacterium]|nr:hypothetical protein [Oscillospiraceae bacterium]